MLIVHVSAAQDTVLNKYGLWVIADMQQLQKTIEHDARKEMIDLKKAIPGLLLDLRYTGTNNFMNEKLYPDISTTYLRKAAADKLAEAQNELNKTGYSLKIFDAYRPYAVTERLWEPVQDDRYAADPKKGSGHNRGIAVDLTIIKLKNHEELDMGTGFDNFSDTAHHSFIDLPAQILQNRQLLKSIMEKYGFVALDTEWWHYYLPNTKDFELLDITFKKLGSSKKDKHVKRNPG
ncbi:MAG: M15 family metallopeptidase [Ferruginibacter sp.]